MDSAFRVEKERIEVTLSLSNGSAVRGCLFRAGAIVTHEGPERIKDFLNAEPWFFPFEVREAGALRTVLYNREHVVMVTLPNDDEPKSDPGYDVGHPLIVEIVLSSGVRLSGAVRIDRPAGHDRLSDHARYAEGFSYLEGDHSTFIINSRHVLELLETVTL